MEQIVRVLVVFLLFLGVALDRVDPNSSPLFYPTIIALIDGIERKRRKQEDKPNSETDKEDETRKDKSDKP